MLIVAKKKGMLGDFDPGVFQIPQVSAALERIYIKGMQDIALRKMGSKRFLGKLVENSPGSRQFGLLPLCRSACRPDEVSAGKRV